MSVAIDRLRLEALAGDRLAIEKLARFFPRDLPPSLAKRWRNEELKALSEKLMVSLQCTPHRAAAILTRAGDILQQHGRSLPPYEFGRMSPEEHRSLESEVCKLLEHGLPWPCLRSMISICKL